MRCDRKSYFFVWEDLVLRLGSPCSFVWEVEEVAPLSAGSSGPKSLDFVSSQRGGKC